MARYLIMWRVNPAAPWPTDPEEYLKFAEKMWTGRRNTADAETHRDHLDKS